MNRILIVEDNIDEHEALRDLLALDGHEVQACCTAEEAEHLFAAFAPEAAIIDIGLPGTHGVELAYRLKKKASQLYVIIVSGDLLKWDIADIRHCGADLVLEKPYDINALRQALCPTKKSEAQAGGNL